MKKEDNFYHGIIVFVVIAIALLLISRFRDEGKTKFQAEQYEKYEQLTLEGRNGYTSLEEAVDFLYDYTENGDSPEARAAMYYIYHFIEGVDELMVDTR